MDFWSLEITETNQKSNKFQNLVHESVYITLMYHFAWADQRAKQSKKCIPGKRDTTEMYPGKVMRIIGG